MNYKETLSYLYTRLPVFGRDGAAAYKADLGNIRALCDLLDHPEKKFSCIHLAGTNGKGSCSHMLAAILQSQGYKTGLYTSPHLLDFRERIRVNGICVDEEKVVAYTNRLIPQVALIEPSFFEWSVAMAFLYFAEQEVDIAVIETGLGGLLDSTNIITPLLSVITNISYDHTALLGNSLSEIALQKAGIIKPRVPVVIGETSTETEPVFRDKARAMQSNIRFADQEWETIRTHHQERLFEITLQNKTDKIAQTYALGLHGAYQVSNLKTVLSSLDVMQTLGWHVTNQAIATGLREVTSLTGLRGRFETLHVAPRVIADVAHNKAGLLYVFEQVSQLSYQHLYILCGFVSDKDVDAALRCFPPEAICFFSQAQIPRALPYDVLTQQALDAGLQGQGYASIPDALQAVMQQAGPDDLLLITGSFFIMQEVYEFFGRV